jgi:hypothetical protein
MTILLQRSFGPRPARRVGAQVVTLVRDLTEVDENLAYVPLELIWDGALTQIVRSPDRVAFLEIMSGAEQLYIGSCD